MKRFKTLISYTLYTLLVAFIFCGCGNGKNTNDSKIEYRTIEIDGCEYITKYNGFQRGFMFAHKGNCKYCKERSEK